jgi:IS30 family transposase
MCGAPEVVDRVMQGHWERDVITGAGNKSSVGVLVEYTTRPVLLAWSPMRRRSRRWRVSRPS